MVLLEAMSVGVPVVSFDCRNGPADLITDGVDGLLVPQGDVVGLAEAMCRLIEAPGWRREMGQAALATADTYTPHRMAARWRSCSATSPATEPLAPRVVAGAGRARDLDDGALVDLAEPGGEQLVETGQRDPAERRVDAETVGERDTVGGVLAPQPAGEHHVVVVAHRHHPAGVAHHLRAGRLAGRTASATCSRSRPAFSAIASSSAAAAICTAPMRLMASL